MCAQRVLKHNQLIFSLAEEVNELELVIKASIGQHGVLVFLR